MAVAEEHVKCAVVEDHDELVGVLLLYVGLEPAHMVNFTLLFNLFHVIVLDHNTVVGQAWVIAADSAGFSAKEQLNLGLILDAGLLVINSVTATWTHL